MDNWQELDRHHLGKYEIVTSIRPEDTHPADLFDDTCHNIAEIVDKIDRGIWDWFVARVQVFIGGHEFGEDYLGGCLYESPKDFLNLNECWGDMIFRATAEADTALHRFLAEMAKDAA